MFKKIMFSFLLGSTVLFAENSDVELARKIRAEISNDKSLSMEAKNISIHTLNGVVSLMGSAKSSNEKMKLENHARNFAKNKNVHSEITVELTAEEKVR